MVVSAYLNNVQPTKKIINEKIPNSHIIRSTIEGELDLPMLPKIEKKAHIFPNIKHSQVSIGSLCDAGFTVIFKIKYVTVVYKYDIITQEWRNHHNKLWYFSLSVENEDEQVGEN